MSHVSFAGKRPTDATFQKTHGFFALILSTSRQQLVSIPPQAFGCFLLLEGQICSLPRENDRTSSSFSSCFFIIFDLVIWLHHSLSCSPTLLSHWWLFHVVLYYIFPQPKRRDAISICSLVWGFKADLADEFTGCFKHKRTTAWCGLGHRHHLILLRSAYIAAMRPCKHLSLRLSFGVSVMLSPISCLGIALLCSYQSDSQLLVFFSGLQVFCNCWC